MERGKFFNPFILVVQRFDTQSFSRQMWIRVSISTRTKKKKKEKIKRNKRKTLEEIFRMIRLKEKKKIEKREGNIVER